MEKINLRRKTIVDVTINDRECEMVLDNYSIDHFQRTNKIGLLEFYQNMKKNESDGVPQVTPLLQLLGSIIRDKADKRPVGTKWLDQFEFADVATMLKPAMDELFVSNLPEAKVEEEKK